MSWWNLLAGNLKYKAVHSKKIIQKNQAVYHLEEKKRAKGINKTVVQCNIQDENNNTCLFNKKFWNGNNGALQMHPSSTAHCCPKNSLSSHDDKRHILDDGIHTVAYGQCKTQDACLLSYLHSCSHHTTFHVLHWK